jgi:hypothetical protein
LKKNDKMNHILNESKKWDTPKLSVLEINNTKAVCDPSKLLPGDDGTIDSSTSAVCGS